MTMKNDCPICMCKMIYTSTPKFKWSNKQTHHTQRLECGHHFHNKCIHKWLTNEIDNKRGKLKTNPTCPMCRNSYSSLQLVHTILKDNLHNVFRSKFQILSCLYDIFEKETKIVKQFNNFLKLRKSKINSSIVKAIHPLDVDKFQIQFIKGVYDYPKIWIQQVFKQFVIFILRHDQNIYETSLTKKFKNTLFQYFTNLYLLYNSLHKYMSKTHLYIPNSKTLGDKFNVNQIKRVLSERDIKKLEFIINDEISNIVIKYIQVRHIDDGDSSLYLPNKLNRQLIKFQKFKNNF